MRRLLIYISALLALSVSCQRLVIPEELPTEKPIGAVGSKATITFSTAELMDEQTKAIIDPSVDVNTLHLVLFDENGMYVETCEATKLGSSDHGDHHSGRHYTVTLTLTDKPRIIHFVANCPVDQIIYGHEISVIGNMYVDKNDREHATEYETSYWARIEVPFILVEETKQQLEDGTIKTVISLHPDIVYQFNHVPLLRNYAEITVTDNTDDTFEFLGYTVYNILDRGTVAPYNSNKRAFQGFIYHPDPTKDEVKGYSYPQLTRDFHYEGHALTSATLITDYARNDDGTVKVFASGEPFYIYERKVSVMTDEEDKWKESPPHIIIKGRYNHGQPVTDASPIYYYKMDLVYKQKDAQGHDEIKFYNIIRNFNYQFNITEVHDEGYTDIDDAVSGPSGNNLSGSTTTSKLTNVSDNEGRLWVSYTDTTLVTNNAVTLKYMYMPNYYNAAETNTYQKVQNDQVRFENIVGDVITSIEVAKQDIGGTGPWAGYREVKVYVRDPEHIDKKQALTLKTNNVHLTRDIRYTLREKLTMNVECTPAKVAESMMQPVQVDIKLPIGLTEDMFPLELKMETFDRTLSPDPVNNENAIPVSAGPSIIDVDGRRGEQSYLYTVTIPTIEAYKALDTEGNAKVYPTHWLTNKAKNASTVYVDNKYFHQANGRWVNYIYTFSNLSCTTPDVGVGKDVTIRFNMDSDDANYADREVTISLEGMTYTGTLDGVSYTDATTLRYKPNNRTETLGGFVTTTDQDKVSFTIDADQYAIASAEGGRNTYKINGGFEVNVTRFAQEVGVEADFSFNIPADAYYDGMAVYVTLNRLVPADDEDNLEYIIERAVGDKYLYRVPASGKQTIRLATAEALEGDCTVTLEAQYFDTEVVTVPQIDRVFEFGDVTATPKQITSSSTVTISFKIPADAWAAGQNTMPVNVTLDRLEPADSKLTGSNGNYVYNVTKSYNNSYSFTVRPTENTAGDCKVTLNAAGFIEKPIDDIEQIVVPSETVLLETNFNNGQVTFNGWGNNSTRNVQNGQLVIYNPSSVNQWEVQFADDFGQAFVVGKTYKLTFRIRGANGNGTLGAGLQNADDDYHSAGEFAPDINFTGTWQTVEVTCTCNYANAKRLIFSFGQYSGSIYIDDFKFTVLE